MGGRKLNCTVREYVLYRVEQAGEKGITPLRLARDMMAVGLDYSPENINMVCWELAGRGRDRGFGRRIHCDRYAPRTDKLGRRYSGGKMSPVFVFGEGENAPPPPLTKVAERQRAARAKARADEAAHQAKVETERRRALKRKPAMDALTCALFGRPLPKK